MRHSIGKLVGLAAAVGLAVSMVGVSSIANARSANGSKAGTDDKEVAQTDPGPAFEQVDSIPMLTRPHSWQASTTTRSSSGRRRSSRISWSSRSRATT